MNRAFIIGNLCKDPELRTTSGGISVCTFTVAVQRKSKEAEKQADFLPVVCWRGLAENSAKYLAKGRQCAVIGSIQTRTYDTANGEKRYVTEILADEVQFLSKGENAGKFDEGKPNEMFGDEGFTPLDEDMDSLPF